MSNLSILKTGTKDYLEAIGKLLGLLETIRNLQNSAYLENTSRLKLQFNQYNRPMGYFYDTNLDSPYNGWVSDWSFDEDSVASFIYKYRETEYDTGYSEKDVTISFPSEWLDKEPEAVIKEYKDYLKQASIDDKKEKALKEAKAKEEKERKKVEREKKLLRELKAKYEKEV